MKVKIDIDKEAYNKYWLFKFIRKYGIYILALVVLIMDTMLIFDNVLWGDEAFSANTVRNGYNGIFEILYYVENHPPFYYCYLKLFQMIFGENVAVYHFASIIPFFICLAMAVFVFKKHFGQLPSALMIVLLGLSAPCVEYSVEVRMYEIAFLAVLGGIYCSYVIISNKKTKAGWIGLVLWTELGAYSHYFGLVILGFIIIYTTLFAELRYKNKSWLKGLIATAAAIVLYLPWLFVFIKQMNMVNGSFWMESSAPIKEVIMIILGGSRMAKVIGLLLAILFVVILVIDAGFITLKKIKENNDEVLVLEAKTPSYKNDTTALFMTYIVFASVLSLFLFAYGYGKLIRPIFAIRYAYPAAAMVFFVIMVLVKRTMDLSAKAENKYKLRLPKLISYTFAIAALIITFYVGIGDYNNFSQTSKTEELMTNAVLEVIGEPTPDIKMVSNGVKHLGYTVLKFYYPDNEVINDNCLNVDCDKMWYFTADFMSEEDLNTMSEKGYEVYGYGNMQMVKYPLVLYFFEKKYE